MEQIIIQVIRRMARSLEPEQLTTLRNVLSETLRDYDIKCKKNEIMTYEDVNQQYFEGFLAWKIMEGKSEKTIKLYGYLLKRAFEELNKNATETSEYDIFIFLAKIQKNGASKCYAENFRRVLASFYSWMYEKEFIKKNPTRGISAIKQDKLLKLPYSDTELEKIREACKDLREKALIEFLYSCGVRVSELCSLTIRDVDFNTGECIVFGKGNKERRVYMNEKCMYILKEYLNSREDTLPYLFVSSRKNTSKIGPQSVRKMLKCIEQRSQVENVHPHRFRRTLATNLLKKGMPIEKVSAILGHSKLETTMVYCSLTREQVKHSYNMLMSA